MHQNPFVDRTQHGSGVASYGALGHVPPRLPTISFLVHTGVNLAATIQVFCSLRDQLVQMSTTHSSFDWNCIRLVTKLLVSEQLLHPALKVKVKVKVNVDLHSASS